MQHNIRYVNTKGDVLDFTAKYPNPYRMFAGDIMNHEWGYTASKDYRLRGEKIVAFQRSAQVYEISLDVLAATEQLYVDAINRLHDVADYDVAALKPGRLYVDGSYLNCYIHASKKERWESPTLFLTVTLSLVAEYPAWWTEEVYAFSKIEHSGDAGTDEYVLAPDTDRADYPFDYAYGDASTRMIDNAIAYKPSEFILRLYGPAQDPYIMLNGISYGVDLELQTQELVEINSYERTIVKRNELTRQETNVFGSGSEHVFDPLPAGLFTLVYSGQFRCELVVLQRRSEPLWTS